MLLFIFICIKLYQCTNDIDPSYCCEGCSLCQLEATSINNYICQQCESNFILDESKNICIYNKCLNNLYFQKSLSIQSDSKQCVALCSNTFISNKSTNICEKQQECSTFQSTSDLLQFQSQVLEAHQLNNDRVIILYQGYYTIMNIQSGILEKIVTVDSDIISIKVIEGEVFIYTGKNNIYLWNEQNEEKQLIQEINNISYSQRNSFIKLGQYYVFAMIFDEDRKQIQLIALFNLSESIILDPQNKFYQIEYQSQDIIINDIIIAYQNQQIKVSRITYQNQNLQNETICQINQNSQITFSDMDQNEFILVIKTSANGIFTLNKESNQCKILEIQEIKNTIKKIKTTTHKNINNSIILMQVDFQFLVFNIEFKIVNTLNLVISENESILIWDIIYTNNFELIILTSLNNVYIHQLNNINNQIQFEKIELEIQNTTSMIKIAPIKEIQLLQQGVLISSQDSLLLLKRNIENQKIENKIFKNYVLPYPQHLGKIIKMVIIEEYSILVRCTVNGFIQIFDTSSGHAAHLIKIIGYDSEECTDLQKILNDKVIVVFSKIIVIINIFLNEEQFKFDITDQETSTPSVSVNGYYTSLSYDGCIMIYENTQFEKKFENCKLISSEKLLNIWLGQSLELYLFTESTIRVIQADITTKEFNILNTYQTQQQQKINCYQVITEQIDNSNRFENKVVEILIFDSQTLRILDKKLIQTHYVTIPEIKNLKMIKRAINDSSFYVLLQTIEIGEKTQFTYIALIKGINLEIKWKFSEYYNAGIIESPFKIKKSDGVEYYLIRLYFNLNEYCQIQDYYIQIQQPKQIYAGVAYTYTSPITDVIFLLNLQSLKSITYTGTEKGELQIYFHDYSKYSIIDVSQYFKNQEEEIIQIEKLIKLEKYFVLTKSQLIVFNMYTDEKEDIIDISLSNLLNSKITILDSQNSVVFSSQNLISIRTYSNKQVFKDYFYNQQLLINDWCYDEKQALFYVYGKGLNSIDAELILKNKIITEETNIEYCILNTNEIVCKSEANLVIIDKKTKNILKYAQIKEFSENFKMFLDIQNNFVYLIEDFIQIYTGLGNYKSSIQLDFKKLKNVDFQDEYAIINSLTIICVLDRISFEQKAEGWVSFNIVKMMYIPIKKQILFSCENPLFSQVLVFEIATSQMAGKITTVAPYNGVGTVIGLFYDYQMDQIIFLDDLANLNCNYFFLNYEANGVIPITELKNKNEQPIDFRFDYPSNQIHVYSKKAIYKINYIQTTDVFQFQLTQNKKFFIIFDKKPGNSLSQQYLIIDDKNIIFIYEDYKLIFQKGFNEEIIDIKYLNSQRLLIIAFYDHFKIYSNYQYSSSYDWSTFKKTDEFLFQRFLDDNLFITSDKQIIQYDFENLKTLNFEKFDQKTKITAYLSLSFAQLFVVGFQNGQILIYDKNNFESTPINNLKETQHLSNVSIQFILELDNFTFLISNINGSIIEYNIQSKDIVSYKLVDLVNLDHTKMYQVSDIKYDKKQKRLLFIFIGNQAGYIWDTQQKKLLSHLSSGNIQSNKITLTNKYIIVSTAFQLNLYQLNDESLYIDQIYGNSFYDQIQEFIVIEEEIIIIIYFDAYQIYYLKDQKPILIQLNALFYPFILEYYYDKIQKKIYLIQLSQSGISQEVINANFINEDIISCSTQIQSDEAKQIQMQIQMIQQSQKLDIFNGEKRLTPSNQFQVYLSVDINSEYISFLNSILKKSSLNTQSMIQPINELENKYILQQSSFSQLELKRNQIKNFQFQVNSQLYQDQIIDINFNLETSLIIWQNITFMKNQNIQGIRINFIKQTEITLFNITLSDQNFVPVIQNDKQDDKNCLFYFENVERVYIYGFNFENNKYTSIQDNFSIFYFKQVKEIIIENVYISNNQNIFNFMRFDLSDIITIKDFKIKQNNCSKEKNENCIILINKGCQEIVVQGIEFSENKQILLMQTINVYELDKMTITYSYDSIQITNSTINQNTCNFKQIVDISQSIILFDNLTFTYNFGNIKINNPKKITIKNSQFNNNQGQNGGAVSVYNLKTSFKLINTNFTNNKALGSGGGLYIENIYSQDIEFDKDSNITNNTALIGGGIRILNKIVQQIIPSQYPFQRNVKENSAELYGDNACNFLQNIILENNFIENTQSNDTFSYLSNYTFEYQKYEINQTIDGQTGILGNTKINSFKSGGHIYLNIFFIDENNKKLKFSKKMFQENQYPDDIIDELQSLSVTFLEEIVNANSIILTGEKILNYNFYKQECNCFQIKELSISSAPSLTKQLQIQFITSKYNNQIKKVLVSIEFRKCQIGEITLQTSSTITICNFCSEGTYSLIQPNSLDNTNQIQAMCKKCPESSLGCQGNMIKLKNGYWRQNNRTDEILACSIEINSCKPEDSMSKGQGCSEGYMGPLCEECDLEGNVWEKYYVGNFNAKQCNECNKLLLQYGFISLQVIGVIMYLIFNSQKLFESFAYQQTCYYLRQLSILPTSQIQLTSKYSSLIKILVSYFQFSSLLVSSISIMPLELNILPNFFGSSNKMMALSISCVFPKSFLKNYGKTLILCLVNTLIPFILVILSYFFLYVVKDQMFTTHNQRKYIIFILLGVIYIFYLQGTISFFTIALSCRQIGSLSYNPIDLNELCNEGKNFVFIKIFSAGILILWTTFPLILLQFLRKQKNQLDKCQTMFKFGYFYLELKQKFYYWEFVRIVLKVLIVIVFTLLKSDQYIISGQIIILMLAQYIKLVTQIKPFLSSEIMSMEILSLEIIIVKVFLQMCTDQYKQAKIIFELLTVTFECSFLIYFILNLSKYIVNNQSSFLGKLLQMIIKRFSYQLYTYYTKTGQVKFETYKRWKKIKQNIPIIVKQKASNMMVQSQLLRNNNETLNSGMNLINCQTTRQKQQSQSLMESSTFRKANAQSQQFFLSKKQI